MEHHLFRRLRSICEHRSSFLSSADAALYHDSDVSEDDIVNDISENITVNATSDSDIDSHSEEADGNDASDSSQSETETVANMTSDISCRGVVNDTSVKSCNGVVGDKIAVNDTAVKNCPGNVNDMPEINSPAVNISAVNSPADIRSSGQSDSSNASHDIVNDSNGNRQLTVSQDVSDSSPVNDVYVTSGQGTDIRITISGAVTHVKGKVVNKSPHDQPKRVHREEHWVGGTVRVSPAGAVPRRNMQQRICRPSKRRPVLTDRLSEDKVNKREI